MEEAQVRSLEEAQTHIESLTTRVTQLERVVFEVSSVLSTMQTPVWWSGSDEQPPEVVPASEMPGVLDRAWELRGSPRPREWLAQLIAEASPDDPLLPEKVRGFVQRMRAGEWVDSTRPMHGVITVWPDGRMLGLHRWVALATLDFDIPNDPTFQVAWPEGGLTSLGQAPH